MHSTDWRVAHHFPVILETFINARVNPIHNYTGRGQARAPSFKKPLKFLEIYPIRTQKAGARSILGGGEKKEEDQQTPLIFDKYGSNKDLGKNAQTKT